MKKIWYQVRDCKQMKEKPEVKEVKKERKRQNIFSKVGGNNTVSTNEHTF
jgi:hypothetical protein